ncbi:MAG TPA: hypothetical protein VHD87_14945 [Acidimicrobiales bacterium]|nr:hypothetical protein [Acidimicrobiales bacterium]
MPTLTGLAVVAHEVVLLPALGTSLEARRRTLSPAATSADEIHGVIVDLAGGQAGWGQVILRLEAAVEDWSAFPSAAFAWSRDLQSSDIADRLTATVRRSDLHWHFAPRSDR